MSDIFLRGMQSYSKTKIIAIALALQLCCLFALTLSQSTDPVNMSMSTLGGFQSADHSLMVYRQFENLQTRVLLHKQDTLFELERELEHFDNSNLFTTQDKEIDKTHLLKRIEQEWTAYAKLLTLVAELKPISKATDVAEASIEDWHVRYKTKLVNFEDLYINQKDDLIIFKRPIDGTVAVAKADAKVDRFMMKILLAGLGLVMIPMMGYMIWTLIGLAMDYFFK